MCRLRAADGRWVAGVGATRGTVLLAGVESTPEVDALVADRRRAGLPTVVDLGAGDLERGGRHNRIAPRRARRGAGRRLRSRGVAHGRGSTAARRLGVRTMVLPTLFTREYGAALLAARAPADPAAALVIGWQPESATPEYRDTIAEGIASRLIDRRNVVELVGDPAGVPRSLAGHERVTVVSAARLDPALFAKWAVHVWTPRLVAGEVAGDTLRFEAVSYVGCPASWPPPRPRPSTGSSRRTSWCNPWNGPRSGPTR